MSAPDVPVLRGARCVLRSLGIDDAPSLQLHADDEAVWRNLFEGFPRPDTLADAQDWCAVIAFEALRLVTAWAWASLPEVTRLFAPIFAWNEGSQGVARKCGYDKEAVLRRSAIKAGQVIDRVQWAAIRATNPGANATIQP